jgi:hypothetical protein
MRILSETKMLRPRPAVPSDVSKITPEMIDAGMKVIWNAFDDVMPHGSSAARSVAIEVFEAMSRAR